MSRLAGLVVGALLSLAAAGTALGETIAIVGTGEVAHALGPVITSYSIHYTKLYDESCKPAHEFRPLFGSAVVIAAVGLA